MAVLNLPGSYMRSKNDEIVLVLWGYFYDLMVTTTLENYRKYMTYSCYGRALLYMVLTKMLYRFLNATMLLFDKLRNNLEGIFFNNNL